MIGFANRPLGNILSTDTSPSRKGLNKSRTTCIYMFMQFDFIPIVLWQGRLLEAHYTMNNYVSRIQFCKTLFIFFLPLAGFLLTLQLSKASIQTFTVKLLSPNDVILSQLQIYATLNKNLITSYHIRNYFQFFVVFFALTTKQRLGI